MEYNYAQKQVQRITKRKITQMVFVIAISVLLLLFWLKTPRPDNLFLAPVSFESGREATDLYKKGIQFVQTDVDVLFHTGWQKTENQKVVSQYYSFWADGQLILCKAGAKLSENYYEDIHIAGRLHKHTSDSTKVLNDVTAQVAAQANVSVEEAAKYISPYYIQLDEDRTVPLVLSLVFYAIIITSLVRLVLAIKASKDYTAHKAYQKLGKAYQMSPEELNEAVSKEIAQGNIVVDRNPVMATESWVCIGADNAFCVYSHSDLIWMYKTVTQHRTNGIPTGKTYGINLVFRDGSKHFLSLKNEKETDEIMNVLYARYPLVLPGYNEEWGILMDKDFPTFVNLVDQFRAQRQMEGIPPNIPEYPQ